MTAYGRLQDVLPCTHVSRVHDWIDFRNDSDEPYTGECSWCGALLQRKWWGWEFWTGQEHQEARDQGLVPAKIVAIVNRQRDRAVERGQGAWDPRPENGWVRTNGGADWGIYERDDVFDHFDALMERL